MHHLKPNTKHLKKHTPNQQANGSSFPLQFPHTSSQSTNAYILFWRLRLELDETRLPLSHKSINSINESDIGAFDDEK